MIKIIQSARTPHGLAFYVKSNHKIVETHHLSTPNFECSLVDVVFEGQEANVTIVVLYKAPTCQVSTFRKHFLDLTSEIVLKENKFILVGDFNFDITDTGNSHILEFMKSSLPKSNQLVCEPTTDANTLLDLAFSNCQEASASTISVTWSFHKTVVVSFPFANICM